MTRIRSLVLTNATQAPFQSTQFHQPSHGRVDLPGHVGRREHQHAVVALAHTLHLHQELRHHSTRGLRFVAAASLPANEEAGIVEEMLGFRRSCADGSKKSHGTATCDVEEGDVAHMVTIVITIES